MKNFIYRHCVQIDGKQFREDGSRIFTKKFGGNGGADREFECVTHTGQFAPLQRDEHSKGLIVNFITTREIE